MQALSLSEHTCMIHTRSPHTHMHMHMHSLSLMHAEPHKSPLSL